MSRPIEELLALLASLDGDFRFDAADPEPSGREKFARRRRLRRLDRLLGRTRREGTLERAVGRPPRIRVDVDRADDGAVVAITVTVDRSDPDVVVDDGSIVVRAGDAGRTVDPAFDPTTVDRTEHNGITTVELR